MSITTAGASDNTEMKRVKFLIAPVNHTARRGYVWVAFYEGDGINVRQVKKERAKKKLKHKLAIVKCYHCDRNAVKLDLFYPYFDEDNSCGRKHKV